MKIPYCNVMIEFELPFIDFDYVSLKNAVNMQVRTISIV